MNNFIAFEVPARNFFQSPQLGISEEARALDENYSVLAEQIGKSQVLSKQSRLRRDVLIDLFTETSHPNWDGYGSKPVSFATYCKADDFIKLIPHDVPFPELSAHPDGEIALEWHISSRKILSISIGSRGNLSFAGIFGSVERHGSDDFINEIPSEILGLFKRITST